MRLFRKGSGENGFARGNQMPVRRFQMQTSAQIETAPEASPEAACANLLFRTRRKRPRTRPKRPYASSHDPRARATDTYWLQRRPTSNRRYKLGHRIQVGTRTSV